MDLVRFFAICIDELDVSIVFICVFSLSYQLAHAILEIGCFRFELLRAFAITECWPGLQNTEIFHSALRDHFRVLCR